MTTSRFSRRPLARSVAILAACSAVFLAALLANHRALPAAEDSVDPEAQKVIDQFSKFYRALEGFRVTVNIDLAVERQGQKQTIKFEQKLAGERPNKFSYLYEGAGGGATIRSDGEQLYVYIKGFKSYAAEEAPKAIDQLFTNPVILGVLSMGNSAPVTMSVFSQDPGKTLISTAESITYAGKENVDDVECHVLSAVGTQMDWKLWIDAGDKPLVRRFVPDLAKAFEKMAAQGGENPLAGIKATNTVSYNDWDLDPKFEADAFAFNVPDGVEKADSLMEMITGGAAGRSAPSPHALLGKPAPAIDLELLDGGQLDLASYKDKNVVILDFWATWCGPCVRAMPIIDKVASKYKDQGVLLFAVNIQESPDEIHEFLKNADLDVNVALDKDGDVARAYMANAIPQTVLVGKDGTVQVVKVGVSADLQESLSGALESLLAGKDLAAETLAEQEPSADESPEADAKPESAKKPAEKAAKE